jgi:hypothetical protein
MTDRYRFVQFWASVLVGMGLAVLAAAAVGAGLVLLLTVEIPVPPPWPRPLVAALAFLGGFVLATPLILTGQVVQIFLDQRQLLGRIHRRLRRWEDEREVERAHPMRGQDRSR